MMRRHIAAASAIVVLGSGAGLMYAGAPREMQVLVTAAPAEGQTHVEVRVAKAVLFQGQHGSGESATVATPYEFQFRTRGLRGGWLEIRALDSTMIYVQARSPARSLSGNGRIVTLRQKILGGAAVLVRSDMPEQRSERGITAQEPSDVAPSVEQPWAGSIDTLPSGTVRTRSPDAESWPTGVAWRLVLDLRIGAVDGNAVDADVFGQITALEVDRAKRIYVLDGHAAEVRVFDSQGAHVRTFGRSGAGPGEMRQPAALTWGSNHDLWVLDFDNGRWVVFDTLGSAIAAHRRHIPFLMMPWPGGFDPAGALVDVASSNRLVRHDLVTGATDSFALALDPVPTFRVRTPTASYTAAVPFAPVPVWHLAAGSSVWYGTGADYRIVQRTLAGDTLRIVERDYRPQRVSSADRAAAIQQLSPWASDVGIQIDGSRIPAFRPAYDGLFTDDRGYLWVVRNAEVGVEFTTWQKFDIFDPAGRYLGEVRSPLPLLPFVTPKVRGNTMYGIYVDDSHVMYVVRMRITGRAP